MNIFFLINFSQFSIDDRVFVDSHLVSQWARLLASSSSSQCAVWHGVASSQSELMWLVLLPASGRLFTAQLDALGGILVGVFSKLANGEIVGVESSSSNSLMNSILSTSALETNDSGGGEAIDDGDDSSIFLPIDKVALFYASPELLPINSTGSRSGSSSSNHLERVKAYLSGLQN